jgi:lysophospholipase L1-like esterase
MRTLKLLAVLALALPLATSCYTDEQLGAAPLPNTGELMRRYLSIGASLTAGFQSAGINDSTQNLAYPVLFASAVGTSFAVPSLNMPGCPPPLKNNAPPTPIDPPLPPPGCALRSHDPLPPFFNNMAVPGAHAIDPLNNLDPESNANTLTMLILGGKTQVQAVTDADPTFVSIWIGGNDVLGALTSSTNPGDVTQITSQADFETRTRAIYDAIDATGANAAVISVPNVTLIPYTSLGAIYWCLKNGGCPAPLPPANPLIPTNFIVDVSCAPPAGVGILVPWTVGVVKILTAFQLPPTQTLDCSDDTQVVMPGEAAAMAAAVTGYNSFLAAETSARGYGYFDINPTLIDAVNSGTIPPFPDITGPLTGGPVTFGPLFSLDGVHPSSESHREIADSLISTVNQTFGTTIPLLP